MTRLLAVGVGALVTVLGGCQATPSDEIGVTQQTLPPPVGASAAYVSDTLPGTWAPDERRVVTVTMNNDGTTTWTPTGTVYRLGSEEPQATWSWSYTNVTTSVAPTNNHTFSFVVTAPSAVAPTMHNFTARMETKTTDPFGATLGPSAQLVDPAATPAWGCTLIADDVPATMTPGEKRTVNLTLQNSGTQTWPGSLLFLESRDTPSKLWDQSRTAIPAGTVAPGATVVARVTITAPSTAGTYDFTREVLDLNAGSIGLFRTRAPHCVTKSIVVGGAVQLDADHISNTFPASMVVDDIVSVSVTMRNTGAETWTAAGGNYVLFSQNTPSALWTTTSTPVTVDTSNGNDAVLTFFVRAPSSAGTYNLRWQMRKLSGTGAAYFGDIVDVPVNVTSTGTPTYGATPTAQSIPTLITAGTTASFSVTMQNTGSTAWSGSTFQLYSTNAPVGTWTTLVSSLGGAETIAAGASRVFTFSVTAPGTAGTYTSSWRMRQSPGVGFFGTAAVTANVVVTLCGNGVVNAGEECDDSNLVNGDACSDICEWEQTEIDLATTAPDRGIVGSITNGQLAAVTIGDVTGDGTPELFVTQRHTPAGISPLRGGAGSVYAFSAGGGFFTGTVTSITASPLFRVAGAAVNDALGLVSGGRIIVGEVTGDATNDLIVSAPGGDATAVGPRTDAGEVYVIAGGAALTAADLLIDLGAMTLPTEVVARIYGADAGDKLAVLAAGDITGDGVGDLVLGAPGNSDGGAAAGAIHIVVGPISGTIDLGAAPANVYTILGGAAGEELGNNAAVGDFGGSAANDLLIGAPKATPEGEDRRGIAYGFFGPLTASTTVGAADVTWLGPGVRVGFGTNVAIGNVTGSAANEAVISASTLRNGADQHGGATVWSGVVAGTYNMKTGATPTSTILAPDPRDECGIGLALGRVNGDTYDDIVMTCSLADGPMDVADTDQYGEMHLVIGAATLPVTYDLAVRPSQLVMFGAEQRDRVGRYIPALAVGDLDGDGFADMCAGSYLGGGASDFGQVNCVSSPY